MTGSGSLLLSAQTSTGDALTYRWSIETLEPDLYTLTNASSAEATLMFTSPATTTSLSIALNVEGPGGSDSSVRNLSHVSEPGIESEWQDLGPLSEAERAMQVGNTVTVRTVLADGTDTFYPEKPLRISADTEASTAWPYRLALAINALTDTLQVGMLDPNGNVEPVEDATANRVYARSSMKVASAFLIVDSGTPESPSPEPDTPASPPASDSDSSTDAPAAAPESDSDDDTPAATPSADDTDPTPGDNPMATDSSGDTDELEPDTTTTTDNGATDVPVGYDPDAGAQDGADTLDEDAVASNDDTDVATDGGSSSSGASTGPLSLVLIALLVASRRGRGARQTSG